VNSGTKMGVATPILPVGMNAAAHGGAPQQLGGALGASGIEMISTVQIFL